jgi:O-methyltransferase
MLKKSIRSFLHRYGYEIRKLPAAGGKFQIPDVELYQPLFSPWLGTKAFKKFYDLGAPRTLVSPDRAYVLYVLLNQTFFLRGDVWECGVYRGGTAAMMAAMIEAHAPGKKLYLFDTFSGMPATDPEKDIHKAGDFSDTSLEAVSSFVGRKDFCCYKKGFIPETFSGLESSVIAFAHIDVDIYQSIIDSLNFIWPKLVTGGVIVFDDYGFPTCPGARMAVDEFFSNKKCCPLCLPTGQAIVFKIPQTSDAS